MSRHRQEDRVLPGPFDPRPIVAWSESMGWTRLEWIATPTPSGGHLWLSDVCQQDPAAADPCSSGDALEFLPAVSCARPPEPIMTVYDKDMRKLAGPAPWSQVRSVFDHA